jgi:hypothetical protein
MAFLTHKCSIRKTIFMVVLLILIGVGGGLLLWKFLPQHKKDLAHDLANGAFIPVEGDAPPPTYIFNQCSETAIRNNNCCNGLETICDLGVDDILYAGIHNSQSTAQDGFYIAPNHQYHFLAALDYGYRALNFDIGVCNEGQYAFVHGKCQLGTMDPVKAFTDLNTWLDANPNEVVLIPLEINNDASSDLPDVDLGKLYNLLLTVPGFTERMYQKTADSASEWPTLRELIAADQRILFFHYNGIRCDSGQITCPPGFHDWFGLTGESKYDFMTVEELDDKESACNITRGRLKGPFYAVNDFLTIPSREDSKKYLNTKAFLQDHIQACEAENDGLDVDVVFVDFWSEGDLPEVVQLHNLQLAATQGQTRKRHR